MIPAALLELASREILYHNTTVGAANLILKNMRFTLPFAGTNKNETHVRTKNKDGTFSDKERPLPGLYYLSFARNLSSGYIADRAPGLRKINNPVTFVVDSTIIKNKNRGVKFSSYDYWGMGETGRSMGSGREAEERMFANSRTVGIKGAIKEVLIVVEEYGAYQTRQVFSFCLKNKIPVKLFTMANFQGFLRRREVIEDRELALSILKAAKREHGYQRGEDGVRPESTKTANKMWEKMGGRSLTEIEIIEALVRTKDKNKLPKRARDFLYYNNNMQGAFQNFIHNLRSEVSRGSKMPARFDKLLKETKSKTLTEFFKKLDAKVQALYEQQ